MQSLTQIQIHGLIEQRVRGKATPTIHRVLAQDELLLGLRSVQTLENPVEIYKDSNISLRRFDPSQLSPIALYVLRKNLENIIEVYGLLKDKVDIFNLTEVIAFNLNGKEIVIGPPVVEYSDKKMCIVDGIHRVFLARLLKREINVAFIENPAPSVPLISYPVEWDEVKIVDERPLDPLQIRRMRVNNDSAVIRHYYRNLSPITGGQGRRPLSTQEG